MNLLKTRNVTLDANGRGMDNQGGGMLIVETISGGTPINITWLRDGVHVGTVVAMTAGRRMRPGGRFSGYEIAGGAGETITLLVGPAEADAGDMAQVAAAVNVANEIEVKNDAGNPLPVKPTQEQAGVGVGAAADAEATGNGSAVAVLKRMRTQGGQAATVDDATNAALIAVDDTGIQVAAADATRVELRVRNAGANAFSMNGAAGKSFDNSAVIVQPGELWIERAAPGAAWYATCDTGLASSAAVQKVTP
jgi:hypothetical protein